MHVPIDPAALRSARALRGLSQGEVADAVSVSRKTFGRYERGGSTPDADTLSRIAEHLGVSVDDLLPARARQVPPAAAPSGPDIVEAALGALGSATPHEMQEWYERSGRALPITAATLRSTVRRLLRDGRIYEAPQHGAYTLERPRRTLADADAEAEQRGALRREPPPEHPTAPHGTTPAVYIDGRYCILAIRAASGELLYGYTPGGEVVAERSLGLTSTAG